MNNNVIILPKNKKGTFCYAASKTQARRKIKKINNKRIRRIMKEVV